MECEGGVCMYRRDSVIVGQDRTGQDRTGQDRTGQDKEIERQDSVKGGETG